MSLEKFQEHWNLEEHVTKDEMMSMYKLGLQLSG